jgi:hypothetical protein
MRRRSPATAIALVALFISLSGTAFAATGGDFLLGTSNKANSVTSLSNKKGTALSLSSSAATPALNVSNSVQVPNLNASEVDGETSSAFLPASGTAVNSNELGGNAASGYMQGGGNTTGARLSLTGFGYNVLLVTPGSTLDGLCDSGTSGPSLYIFNNASTAPGASAMWWNKDGVGDVVPLGSAYVTPGSGSTALYMVVVQVDNVTSVTTYTASERYNSGTDTCSFTAQAVTTNG